jgi:hypothetical protein
MSTDAENSGTSEAEHRRSEGFRITRQSRAGVVEYGDGDELSDRLIGFRAELDEILASGGLFRGIDPTAVSAFSQPVCVADFPRGYTLFAQGEPGDRFYIVISGKVKIGCRIPDGRQYLLTISEPSDIICELSKPGTVLRTCSRQAIVAEVQRHRPHL